MSLAVRRQVRSLQHQAKVFDIAVQIATDYHVAGVMETDDAAYASRRVLPVPGRLTQRCQQSGGIGHESSQESVCGRGSIGGFWAVFSGLAAFIVFEQNYHIE